MTHAAPVTVLGSEGQGGAYLLRLHSSVALSLSFGRFLAGEPVLVPAGEALYVGSARGEKGASSLARRLLRHATRSGDQPPHALRAAMVTCFAEAGLGDGRLPAQKTCFWHADYLLDRPEVSLTHVLAIRATAQLEPVLADLLLADPHTAILAPGLGASDSSGKTHLLHYDGGDAGWVQWIARAEALLTAGP